MLEGQGVSMSALKSDAIDEEGLVSSADDATEECNEQRCSIHSAAHLILVVGRWTMNYEWTYVALLPLSLAGKVRPQMKSEMPSFFVRTHNRAFASR